MKSTSIWMLVSIAIVIAPPVWAGDEVPAFTCTGPPFCPEGPPSTPFEQALCSDSELNDALIEAAKHGDRSAIDLLRERYETADTYFQKHRIAATLLGRVDDDGKYWNELSARAKEAVRFPYVEDDPPPEFMKWCESRGVDPVDYRSMALNALVEATLDPRGRTLARTAFETNDRMLIVSALAGILTSRDEAVLPDIEKVLVRVPEEAEWVAMSLASFRSAAADQIAMKHLPADQLDEYRALQREADCENMTPCDP